MQAGEAGGLRVFGRAEDASQFELLGIFLGQRDGKGRGEVRHQWVAPSGQGRVFLGQRIFETDDAAAALEAGHGGHSVIDVLALAETILFQEVRSIRQNRHQGCAEPGFDGTILGVGAADFDLVGGDQFESAEDGLLGDSGGAGQFPVPAVAGDGEGFIPRLDFRLTESGENAGEGEVISIPGGRVLGIPGEFEQQLASGLPSYI